MRQVRGQKGRERGGKREREREREEGEEERERGEEKRNNKNLILRAWSGKFHKNKFLAK